MRHNQHHRSYLLKMSNKNETNIINPYFELYARIEEEIIMNNLIDNANVKSFAILFCILIEVVVNIDDKQEIAAHKESCGTLLSGYFHHLHVILQTGSIVVSSDFMELRKIVGLIQSDIKTPCPHNKKMIEELVSRVIVD